MRPINRALSTGQKIDLARLVRRRLLTPVHAGVYINHTGDLTWIQRAWAAVLKIRPCGPDCTAVSGVRLIRLTP